MRYLFFRDKNPIFACVCVCDYVYSLLYGLIETISFGLEQDECVCVCVKIRRFFSFFSRVSVD